MTARPPAVPTAGLPAVPLLLRCDDAGAGEGANHAIARAAAACAAGGVALNVSVMAVGSAVEGAARRLRDARSAGGGRVCLGLHVTLNAEWPDPHPRWRPVRPAARVASLVAADGTFHPTPDRARQAGGLDLDQVSDEAAAQLARLRALGLEVDYLDEHMGVGWLPGVRDRLSRLAEREGLVEAERFALLPRPARPVGVGGVGGVGALWRELADRVAAARASGRAGPFAFVTHPDHALDAPPGSPAWPGGPADAARRDAERRLLLDPDLPRRLADLGTEPTTYRRAHDLAESQARAAADPALAAV